MSLSGGHEDSVNTLVLNESADLLASGGDDGYLCLWSTHERRLVSKVLHESGDTVTSAVFGGPGRPEELFVSHGSRILVWDTRYLHDPVHVWSVNEDEINCLALHKTESRLAAADDQGTVQIVDTESGNLIRTLQKHENICSSVLFRPNRPWQVVSGGLDCIMVASDWLGSGQSVGIFNMTELLDDCDLGLVSGSTVNPPMLHCLAATADGEFVACGLENGTVEVFAAGAKNLVHVESLCGHTQAVSCLLCVGGGGCLVSGGSDTGIYVWQLDSEGQGRSYSHHAKINKMEGRTLEEVFVADNTDVISIHNLAL